MSRTFRIQGKLSVKLVDIRRDMYAIYYICITWKYLFISKIVSQSFKTRFCVYFKSLSLLKS